VKAQELQKQWVKQLPQEGTALGLIPSEFRMFFRKVPPRQGATHEQQK
jgi:hypothetical protein